MMMNFTISLIKYKTFTAWNNAFYDADLRSRMSISFDDEIYDIAFPYLNSRGHS